MMYMYHMWTSPENAYESLLVCMLCELRHMLPTNGCFAALHVCQCLVWKRAINSKNPGMANPRPTWQTAFVKLFMQFTRSPVTKGSFLSFYVKESLPRSSTRMKECPTIPWISTFPVCFARHYLNYGLVMTCRRMWVHGRDVEGRVNCEAGAYSPLATHVYLSTCRQTALWLGYHFLFQFCGCVKNMIGLAYFDFKHQYSLNGCSPAINELWFCTSFYKLWHTLMVLVYVIFCHH